MTTQPANRRASDPSDAASAPAPGEMLADLVARLDAEGAALLRVAWDRRVDILAVHPAPAGDAEPPGWLTAALTAAGEAAETDRAISRPLHDADALYGQPAGRHVLLKALPHPLRGRGVLAVAGAAETEALADALTALTAEAPAIELLGLRVAAASPPGTAPPLEDALAVLAAVQEHDRFLAAAMACCNELAARCDADRVSLGLARDDYVRLAAMSHTERFSRRMEGVQRIEAAMEECLDQDVEIALPGGEGEHVVRATADLARASGSAAVLSLPLRRDGRVVGVLTLERDRPFTARQIESLRLTCDICTPRLTDLRRRDRWAGAKLADAARRGLATLLGPRHTWAKLAVVLLAAAAIWLAFAEGTYRIDAPMTLRAARKQVIPAPFAGQLEAVGVEVGDRVAPGDELARLRTVELRRQRSAVRAELFEHRKQADAARSDKRWAEAQMAAARVSKLQQRDRLLTRRIDQAALRSRLAGTVVRGDLKRFAGAAVEKGQLLFEIADLHRLRARIRVDEDQLADLLAALADRDVRGRLAAAAYPDDTVDFTVTRVWPVAEESDGRKTFAVRAELAALRPWMRPGMTGIAHIDLGRRRLAWIWTRRLANRLRLWLWM